MNRRALLTALGIGAVVALFAFPGMAIAKGGKFVIEPSRSVEFHAKGSKGYSISVSGNGGVVSLTARHGHSSATYSARGISSPTKIKARFGRLGRISVQFQSAHGPKRQVPLPEGNCQGEGEIVDSGSWVGKIEFEGEQAYTTLHATRAKGKVTRVQKQTCSKQEGTPSRLHLTTLSATSNASGVLLTAFQITSKAHPVIDGSAFGASLIEFHGRGLSIVRSINVSAPVDAFASTEEGGHITSVTITPPAPFEGTGTFQRTGNSRGTWLGSLTGDFPGRSDIALAGPGFSAKTSRFGG